MSFVELVGLGETGMLAKTRIDRTSGEYALKLMQAKIGGEIRGSKLLPLRVAFAQLMLPAPNLALERRAFLLQVAPQKETAVYEELTGRKLNGEPSTIKTSLGLDAYLPMEPKSVKINGVTRRTVDRPLMPGYVFPIFDTHRDRWQSVQHMRYVVRLFTIQERPVPIPQIAIDVVKSREIEANMRGKAKQAAPWLEVGRVIQFTEWPWMGFFGTIDSILDSRARIAVMVDLFGRQTPVEVSVNQVRAV